MTMKTDRLETLEVREKPTAGVLVDEVEEAITAASGMGVFTRLLRCKETSRCEWGGKRGDGRLGERDDSMPVFRWQGAPDLGVPLCGKMVRWLKLLRMSVYNRGSLSIGPRRARAETDGGGDATGLAGVWQQVCDYLLDVSDWGLSKAFELFSTTVEELGYGVMLADWRSNWRMERVPLTIQMLTDALIERRRAMLMQMLVAEAEAGGMQMDLTEGLPPELDAEAVNEAMVELEELLMRGPVTDAQAELVMLVDERMSVKEAKRVLKELRDPESGGEGHYHVKRADGGCWKVEALIPWVSVLHPYDLRPTGEAGWVARPVYLSREELMERSRAERWHKGATKRLLEEQANQFWAQLSWVSVPWALNGVGVGMVIDAVSMERNPRWLVVEMWRRVVDADGLPRIGRAVFSPHMREDGDLLLWQETDLERLPIVVDVAEPCEYAMMARGAADIIVDKQNFVKDGLDAEGARGQLGSNPPLLRTVGTHVDLRPGRQMYAKRAGSGFDGSQFMAVPGVDKGHLEVVEKVEQLVEQFYFRSADTSPEDRAMFEESVRFASMRCYKELLRLLWVLAQEHVDHLLVSRINGVEVELDARRDQLQGEADIHIGVHLDGYSQDAAEKFVRVFTQLSQADRFGALDAAEGMNIATQLLAPTYARRLVMSQEKASGRVIDEQEQRIAKIVAGVPVQYEERVSNPMMRMQVMQAWMQVPENMQRLQAAPAVSEMMEKELQYLHVQTQQQTVNPVTGRTGVEAN
jgi:hypothetical protein